MSAPATEVLVTVTMRKDTYHARAGNGFFKSKTANDPRCGPYAAQAAAAKFLRVPEERISLQKHAPGVFKATVAELTTEEPTA